jgi:hypothetical protein
LNTYERITAADVKVGDRIAQTRNDEGDEVIGITDGPKSRYIERRYSGRLRPRYETKLWRVVPDGATDVRAQVEANFGRAQ